MAATIQDRLQCEQREDSKDERNARGIKGNHFSEEVVMGSPDLSAISLFPDINEAPETETQVQEVQGMDPAIVLGSFFKVSSRVANTDDGIVTADMLLLDSEADDVQLSASGNVVSLTDDDLRALMRYGTRGTAASSK